MITFRLAHAKSATANVGKEEVTISFVMTLNDESMEAAKALGFLIGKGPLSVVVNPKQMQMELTKSQRESQENQ